MKNIDLKVGDLVYCYKTSYSGDKICTQEGKYYKIMLIRSFDTYHSITIGSEDYGFIYYITNYSDITPFMSLFYDFFMSKKEYRKLKLEKLNERI